MSIKYRHYKYIHFFYHDDLKFNPRIVEMVNDRDNGFDANEHLFITPYKHVYDAISKYDNVILYDTSKPSSARMINEYAEIGNWLIIHSLPIWYETLKIKRKYRGKIIWRTWGHEFGYLTPKSNQPAKNFVKKIVSALIKREINQFRAVGIANAVDELDIRERFGEVPTFELNYPTKNSDKALKEARDNNIAERDVTNVLIGHSGHPVDNHIGIVDALEKYKDERIQLYFILSYGNEEYIKRVKEYIKDSWGEKATVISDFMPYADFLKFCATMDIAIFDGPKSYALGNVGALLFLEKKLFLRRDGVLCRAFIKDNIPFNCTDEIENMSFEEFTKKLKYSNKTSSSLYEKSYREYIENWHIALSALTCE